MKYQKLNKNWNAKPSDPDMMLTEDESDVELSFLLNSEEYQHIDENEKGSLMFHGVYAYQLVPINKEEYLEGSFKFRNKHLPWGEFYELQISNWQKDFSDDFIILDETVNKKKMRHFIFFLEDELFECIASEYIFEFTNSISEFLEEKYPKGYLDHYLAMYVDNFKSHTNDDFLVYTNLYIQMEGIKEFEDLKTEIKNIRKNNDINAFLKFANNFVIENFGQKQLEDVLKVIETYKIAKR